MKGTRIKLNERHSNGATIEVKGAPEEAAKILIDWREYQDGKTVPKNTAGFKAKEEQK